MTNEYSMTFEHIEEIRSSTSLKNDLVEHCILCTISLL